MHRARRDLLFRGTCFAAGLFAAGTLIFLLGVILWNGAGAITLEFLLTPSRDFGAAGGIFHQICGSLLIVLTAGLIALPVALASAVFKAEYLTSPALTRLSDILIYGLNATPSIAFGIFGLIVFVNVLGTGISWFVGSIVLAIMMLPTLTLAIYQTVRAIPRTYRENAYALGLTRPRMVVGVILPGAVPGMITGLLIALARAIGETAPIMFIATAFSGVSVPGSPFEPAVTLPTHILALAQQASDARALANAWGTSLVLIGLVLVFSLSALVLRQTYKRGYGRGV